MRKLPPGVRADRKANADRQAHIRKVGVLKWASDIFGGDLGGEEWHPIPGYVGLYEVSSHGRVKSLGGRKNCRLPRLMRQATLDNGYKQVTLSLASKKKAFSVHRLVCQAFHGNPPSEFHHAAHGDNNRANNRKENLRWATPKENQADREIHGTKSYGEKSGRAKLTEAQVLVMRRALSNGASVHRCAVNYDVTESTVKNIRSRKTWPHLAQ